jgi:HSP90 family molecular chaperone
MDTTVRTADVGLTVDLQGIIEIFGNSLYNEFGAIVRELAQNGHDAVIEAYARRDDRGRDLEDYWVNVHYDERSRTLVIADSGIGMDKESITKNLNEFGKSGKRDVREEVARASRGEGLYIIGLYGVGFLSAMAVSERVEVWSKSAHGAPILWLYETGGLTARVEDAEPEEFERLRRRYGLRAGSPEGTGSLVICTLSAKVEEEYLVDSDVIREGLRRYARLLRVPVFFNGERISTRSPAWADPARASPDDWGEMIREATGDTPLLVIPVYSPPDKLDLEGVLWIPPRRTFLGDTGHIEVYVRRMFVTRDDRLIRPEWARFLTGMINSNKMGRIVSGNTVIEDRHAAEAREFIKDRIIEAFCDLRSLPEEEYWRVIGKYDDIIKKSAADNEEFLSCVWDKLRVKARSRWLTVPECLASVKRRIDSDNVLYCCETENQDFAAGVVSDSTKIPVLSLWSLADSVFVKAVVDQRKLDLRPYNELADAVIKKPADEDAYQGLITACAAEGIAAEIREYAPVHMPAILMEDTSVEEQRAILLDVLQKTGNRTNRAIAKQFQDMLIRGSSVNRGAVFYLNASNTLIEELLAATFETQRAIGRALYCISYMSLVPELRQYEVETIYKSICSVLMTLLQQGRPDRADDEGGGPRPHGHRPTRLFLITPYAAAYQKIEAAVREVFESPPYFFEIVLARDFMNESQLLENIRSHIEAADGFIAEISELNPNVLLELGAVLVKKDHGRPAILLRATDGKEIPADIRGELCVPYGSLAAAAEAIVDDIRRAIESNGRTTLSGVRALLDRQTCKVLTAGLLRRPQFRLSPEEADLIRKSYPTVEQFLGATPGEVARVVAGLEEAMAKYAQDQLRKLIPPAEQTSAAVST